MAIFYDAESKQDIFDLIDKFDKSNLFDLEISMPPPQPQYIKIKMMKLSQEHPDGPAVKVTVENSESFDLKKDIKNINSNSSGAKIITAPLVGTFYSSPSPDSEPYVKIGDKVSKGMTVCIIEAMKVMNEIESEADGEIVEILVENNNPVEYGQPLFRLK